ncbi:MAG: hypothetical protein HF300_15910 [Ignavibacteria bacterium]|jgi:hypothetical protein|nr:hypothetical protein [Ignavibacteria bacterium]MCU7498848.1 hypothetical protein [Ignavibacteria bacterium]MCU7514044.1 hypothetical protein [Ignavibacteria bacterium]MCU7520787.1 hypothetical protein [Ignavibacteria bacterium]MCU7523813.1 hypothetical protein [Ignavibacteria bacterium]
MSSVNEIDVIKEIDISLSKIEDEDARNRILTWVNSKYLKSPQIQQLPVTIIDQPIAAAQEKTKIAKSSNGKSKSARKTTFSIVKEISLRPDGVKSFKEFVKEKDPKSDQEKCLVAVYYLKMNLNIENIDANYVFTCFKDAGWRTPANLTTTLTVLSSQKGWVDTSSLKSIVLTNLGEDYVEHDLPAKGKNEL